MAYISFSHVIKECGAGEGRILALSDASFEVEKGELAVILGSSGAGKLTGALDYSTGKQILQLLQDTCRKDKVMMLIITHNAVLAPMADRFIRFKKWACYGDKHKRTSYSY